MKMHGLWLSFKEVMNCSTNTSQVSLPIKCCHVQKVNPPTGIVCQAETPAPAKIEVPRPKPNTSGDQFSDLNTGDTTRNIVELIFRTALIKPKNVAGKKIEKVLKVKNSPETIERFEDYRKMVQNAARELQKRHPRSVADGNELLRFHATTMACCCSGTEKVTRLCRNQECGVCQIIRSGFAGEETSRKGYIRLSAFADEDQAVMMKGEMKKATVVCRVIAGRVVNGGEEECCDVGFVSIESRGLLVGNPSAVLPCFVIVYS